MAYVNGVLVTFTTELMLSVSYIGKYGNKDYCNWPLIHYLSAFEQKLPIYSDKHRRATEYIFYCYIFYCIIMNDIWLNPPGLGNLRLLRIGI